MSARHAVAAALASVIASLATPQNNGTAEGGSPNGHGETFAQGAPDRSRAG
jgi:hypothetical protein